MERPILSSPHNPQLQRVRRWLEKPRQCRIDGVFLADGIHLVQEALAAGLACTELFVDSERIAAGDAIGDPTGPAPVNARTELATLVEVASSRGIPVHRVLPKLFRAISPVETPQGVLGVFDRPKSPDSRLPSRRGDAEGTSSHVVVASGVQDPTNLGSLIRSARATGIREVLTTRGTVDPYHHRALRASMGATFHLHLRTELSIDELLSLLTDSGRRTLALSSRGETPLASLDPTIPSAIVFGSEGSGLPPELESALDLRVRIPMEPGVESLAVPAAAAVVFYWLYLRGGADIPAGDSGVPGPIAESKGHEGRTADADLP